jgi:hypothetical protein
MNSKESPEVWTPPELTALVRNKPEEAVLTICKEFWSLTPSGSQKVASGCHYLWPATGDCVTCALRSNS